MLQTLRRSSIVMRSMIDTAYSYAVTAALQTGPADDPEDHVLGVAHRRYKGPLDRAAALNPAAPDEKREAGANHLVANADVTLFIERHCSLLRVDARQWQCGPPP